MLNPKPLWALLQADYQRRSISNTIVWKEKNLRSRKIATSHVNAELHDTHNVTEIFTHPHKH